MSKLETNTIDTVSGTTNLTIGSTNTSTITMPNGKLTGHNYPAFEVTLSTSNQVISDETDTKITWNDVNFDTNSNWNSSNYRWLPTVAGKYFIYLQVGSNGQGSSQLTDHFCSIRKNGTTVSRSHNNPQTGGFFYNTLNTNIILTMNGSTDYVEGWTRMNDTSGSPEVQSGLGYSKFGAYRIGA